jgi:hypothetical protein
MCFLWRQNKSGGKLLPHSDLQGGSVSEGRIMLQAKRDILLGTWNVRSLYRAGSLMTVAKELARYKLGLVGVQKGQRGHSKCRGL